MFAQFGCHYSHQHLTQKIDLFCIALLFASDCKYCRLKEKVGLVCRSSKAFGFFVVRLRVRCPLLPLLRNYASSVYVGIVLRRCFISVLTCFFFFF